MQLFILGSGTSVPHAHRASPAFWLETSGGTLLLDVSADATHRMAEEQLDWPNLDAIWVSHFHLDHVGGLAPFLFGIKWAPHTQGRNKLLRIFGPEGLRRILESVDDSNNYRLLELKFPVDLVEVRSGEAFELLPGVMAETFSTPHTAESKAIRLTEKDDTSFVYTSDTGTSDELVEFCKDATLLLLECSFRKDKPVPIHLELSEAMEIAGRCSPRTLVLTHLYPEWDGINLAAEAKALWPGETIEAKDGLRLNF